MRTWIKVILALCIAAGLLGLGVIIERSRLLVAPSAEAPSPAPENPLARRAFFLNPGQSDATAIPAPGSGNSVSFAEVAAMAGPSVVSVASKHAPKESVHSGPNTPFGLPFGPGGEMFQFPFPIPGAPGPSTPREGLGSGVIVSEDGLVLTNNHVIEGATEITVVDVNDKRYQAEVVGADPPSDIALLRLKQPGELQPMQLGNSGQVRPGDVVLAIGNPFGVGQTVTMGIVSAKGRSAMGIVDYEDFIQTDAAINPGNSGGALISMDGRLIGINTAILSRTGAYAGIGFAVPTDMARPIMESLLEHGKVSRGFLGVTIQDVDADLAAAMDLKTTDGILVTEVSEGSPAGRAGLQRGDVLIQLDGKRLDTVADLRNSVASKAPGSKVSFTLLREGKQQEVQVELGELPTSTRVAPGAEQGPSYGIGLGTLDESTRQKLQLSPDTRGAVVTGVAPNSSAARAGLKAGDVIIEVNRKQVSSPNEVSAALSDKSKGAVLLVNRGGQHLYVALKPVE